MTDDEYRWKRPHLINNAVLTLLIISLIFSGTFFVLLISNITVITPSSPPTIQEECIVSWKFSNQSNWNITTNVNVDNITVNSVGYLGFVGTNGYNLTYEMFYNITHGQLAENMALQVSFLPIEQNITDNLTVNISVLCPILTMPALEFEVGFTNGTQRTYEMSYFGGVNELFGFNPSVNVSDILETYNTFLLNESRMLNYLFTDVDFYSSTQIMANINWSITDL